jgi:hypothetical protein
VTPSATRALGLAVAVTYAAFIGYLWISQPQTLAEAVGGVSAAIGTYQIDREAFAEGRAFFLNDQFVEARAAFARADPARRDPVTQFYIAYTFYRQGWYRTHRDDDLYRQGVEAIDHAIALSSEGRVFVMDDHLQMRSSDELKAELEAGLRRDTSDFNPLRLFETRK